MTTETNTENPESESEFDEEIDRHPIAMTGWQRLSQTFVNPPKARPSKELPDYTGLSSDQIRDRINRVDDVERKVGLGAAILTIVFDLVFTLPYMISKIAQPTTVKPAKNQPHCPIHMTYIPKGRGPATCNTIYPPSHFILPLVVWGILGLSIFIAVRVGRRSFVAFAMIITGLAFGTIIVLVPFVGGGAWLLVRAWRIQRYGSPTAKSPVPGYVRPTSRAAPRRRPSSPRPTSKPTATERSAPTASKRYTPKAPPRKKPPVTAD